MWKRCFLLWLVILMLPASFPQTALGQANSGTILGTVADVNGASVPNCKVIARNTGTGVAKEVQTDENGSYRITYLIPGAYEVVAEKVGFKRSIEPSLELQVGQQATINFALSVGDISEGVEVTGESELLQAQSAEQSQVINTKQMQELPLNYRDFAQLATLVPGAVIGTGGQGTTYGADNPQGSGGALVVNGSHGGSNNWQIDGITNNEQHFNLIVVSPSMDAIQEFKVTTNNYSAEYGRAVGANVQIQIKSGTNDFHGGAFEFLRNDKLDANNFFNNRSGQSRKPYKQNQFGAFLGGPILKNKTFFFGDFEVLRRRETTTGLITIPTLLQRQGIFTEPGQATIYDPLNGQPFPNNTIPANRINPAARRIMSFFPEPNVPGGGLTSNFFGASNLQHDRQNFDIKVDHNIGEKDQAFAKYSFQSATIDTPPYLGEILNGQPNATTAFTRNQHVVVSEIHTFSPNTINELRFGVNRLALDWSSFGQDRNTSDEVGIPGINSYCGLCGGLPRINIQGMTVFGHTSFAPTERHGTTWQFVDNVTLTKGKHTFKVGVDYQFLRMVLFQTSNPVGQFNFDRNMTSNQGSGGIGLATFLLGNYANATRQTMTVPPDTFFHTLGTYLQDDVRVTPNLTLNLGLRYDIAFAPTDRNDRITNFDPKTGDLLVACEAISCTGGVKTQYNNLGPRMGLAYTFGGGKNTIRLGAGLSIMPPYNGGLINTLSNNYPFVIAQDLRPSNIYTPSLSLSDGFTRPPAVEFRPGAAAGHIIPKGFFDYIPAEQDLVRSYQWSLSLQRQITQSLMVDATYVGNSQLGLLVFLPQNIPRPGEKAGLPLQQRRPYYSVAPDLATFQTRISAGRGSYHSMQLKAEKRFSAGLSFLTSYTWSKTLQAGGFRFGANINPFAYMEKGLADHDAPHRFVVSYVYELPLGKRRRFGNEWPGAVDGLLGGWQVSGVTYYQSGLPFTPSIASNLDNGLQNRPNRICAGKIDNPTIDRWFDTKCFVASPFNVFGNAGINILRGPSVRNWDITLSKNFVFKEGLRLQFRTDLLNAFNQVNFGNPNSAVDNPGGGTISGFLLGYNPRLIQFGLKFYF